MSDWRMLVGDCVEAMAAMEPASVDAIVTDPPYGLGFMGKEWDTIGDTGRGSRARVERVAEVTPNGQGHSTSAGPYLAVGVDSLRSAGKPYQAWTEVWATEALRVLKPGGHLLAFGGTRTSHRLVCAIEDAGFEIRDMIAWIYGSGFPKSLDVSKAIDKAAGAERAVVGPRLWDGRDPNGTALGRMNDDAWVAKPDASNMATAPATPEAQRWDGWGTALKPAHEPIVVARKPLDGTVSATVLRHGTGALNVDGCRVGYETVNGGNLADNPHLRESIKNTGSAFGGNQEASANPAGRWPANLVLSHSASCQPVGTRRVKGSAPASGPTLTGESSSVARGKFNGVAATPSYADSDGTEEVAAYRCTPDCPVRLLDEQTGDRRGFSGGGATPGEVENEVYGKGWYRNPEPTIYADSGGAYADSGGASRFFPTFDARHEDAERRFLYCAKAGSAERSAGLNPAQYDCGGVIEGAVRNTHPLEPTVKPIALMRWLVRLVTPPNGTVLDPFAGSGTTGIAAALEGFEFVGIEREAEYAAIAEARIAWWREHPDSVELVRRLELEKERSAIADAGQVSIFDLLGEGT